MQEYLKNFFLIILFTVLFGHLSFSQVYNYKTGEIIPNAKEGTFVSKKGTFYGYPADYGVIVVTENRNNKNSRLITLPVVIVHSLDTINREPIFLLNGGPGVSNIWESNFPDYLLKNHEIVMVGYRGVEGTTILDCPDIRTSLLKDEIFSDEEFNYLGDQWRNEAVKFKDKRIDIEGYTIEEVATDLETVRVSLGYKSVNLFAFSYGTMIAHFYINKYPKSINRVIMIGARPYGNYLYNPKILDKKINALYEDILHDGGVGNIKVSFNELFLNSIKYFMENSTLAKIDSNKFLISIFLNLYNLKQSNDIVLAIIRTNEGDYQKFEDIYKSYELKFLKGIVLGDYAIKINCSSSLALDTVSNNFNENCFGNYVSGSINLWNSSFNICKTKVSYKLLSLPTNVRTLFISGKYDFITPYELVESQLLPIFTNSEYLLLEKKGHEDLIDINSDIKNTIISFYKE